MNEPTRAEDMMRALLLVLMDQRPSTDAMFIHGSSVSDKVLDYFTLKTARDMLKRGETKSLVINGVSEKVSKEKKIAYCGVEPWLNILSSFGVESENVIQLPASLHTAAESDNLINLALEHSWQSLTIFALPHHILRCMLQIVYLMETRKVSLKVYARTLESIDWTMPANKTILGGGTISGTLFDHIEAEYGRVEKYKQRDGSGFTPHATVHELIEYIRERDGMQ